MWFAPVFDGCLAGFYRHVFMGRISAEAFAAVGLGDLLRAGKWILAVNGETTLNHLQARPSTTSKARSRSSSEIWK